MHLSVGFKHFVYYYYWLKTALAHEAAYNVGYLHRDISDNDIMVVLEDGKPVEGILSDWDLALRVKDENGNWVKEHNRRQRCLECCNGPRIVNREHGISCLGVSCTHPRSSRRF